ncbi:unnamed protein product [Meganyctiphanes norvegica]|uniref:Oplophorus-luciferin 2-monooxygenase non-catalytic subunit n=1 Tax=Meganyctiphanes norvegica TaxID=48144 RepID=A0AAV2RKA7_MEGNR
MRSHNIILLYIVVVHVSGQINDHKDPIPSIVYNQHKVHVMQGGFQGPIPSDVYNQNKIQLVQGGHQDPMSSYVYNQNKIQVVQGGHQDSMSSDEYNQNKIQVVQGGHQDPMSSDVYSQNKIQVVQGGHQDPMPSDVYNQNKIQVVQGGHQDPIPSDVYNQSKLHLMQDGHQDPTPSDVYNQSKVHVTQDGRHQPEYYRYERPCPDAEDIAPCVCTYHKEDNVMDLWCSSVDSEDQLKQIFKADFPFKNFREFRIQENNNLTVLEAGVFNGISFEIINIIYNKLEIIELQALDSCYETATEIYLYYNNITSFPFDELSHFSKLSRFDISDNHLSMIPADAFNGLTVLEHLNIFGNRASIVGTFQDLPNLRGIDLSVNAITTVPVHFIKTGSSGLYYIGLDDNNIISVEPGAFDNVDGLVTNMWSNSLSTLEEATWRPCLEAGGKLWAAGNPLVCGCDIAWLFGDDQLLEQVDDGATCTDGENLHDLDPSIFDPC